MNFKKISLFFFSSLFLLMPFSLQAFPSILEERVGEKRKEDSSRGSEESRSNQTSRESLSEQEGEQRSKKRVSFTDEITEGNTEEADLLESTFEKEALPQEMTAALESKYRWARAQEAIALTLAKKARSNEAPEIENAWLLTVNRYQSMQETVQQLMLQLTPQQAEITALAHKVILQEKIAVAFNHYADVLEESRRIASPSEMVEALLKQEAQSHYINGVFLQYALQAFSDKYQLKSETFLLAAHAAEEGAVALRFGLERALQLEQQKKKNHPRQQRILSLLTEVTLAYKAEGDFYMAQASALKNGETELFSKLSHDLLLIRSEIESLKSKFFILKDIDLFELERKKELASTDLVVSMLEKCFASYDEEVRLLRKARMESSPPEKNSFWAQAKEQNNYAIQIQKTINTFKDISAPLSTMKKATSLLNIEEAAAILSQWGDKN